MNKPDQLAVLATLPLSQQAEHAEAIQRRVASGDASVTDEEITYALSVFHALNPSTSKPPGERKARRKPAEPQPHQLISTKIGDL